MYFCFLYLCSGSHLVGALASAGGVGADPVPELSDGAEGGGRADLAAERRAEGGDAHELVVVDGGAAGVTLKTMF